MRESEEEGVMGKTLLQGILSACIVWAGCSSDGNDNRGTGGSTGPATAAAFDGPKSLEVGPTAAGSVAVGVRMGSIVSNVLSTLGSGLLASTPNLTRKILVSGFCSAGTADVTIQPPLDGMLATGDVVTLSLDNCAGSPVSEDATSGTIVLEMLDVSGGLPVIGGILEATATLNLSIAPDTTITGSFNVDANLPSFALANLTFGNRSTDDLITVNEGIFQAQFACFDIFQRVGLAGPGVEFFRPLGVLQQGTEVFTMNNYDEAPPNIGFTFAGFDATPQSGSLTLDSGDNSGGVCGVFGTPTPNDSFVTATFTGGGCVSLDGTDTQGTPFSLVTTWEDWLDAGQPGSTNECEGTGGTGGMPSTGAMASPVSCSTDANLVTIADAYIKGDGPEGFDSDNNFGSTTNLLLKSVTNAWFTRKIYLAFDISSLSEPVSSAYLVLTVRHHIDQVNGPQPANVYGIVDDDDWDPGTLAETAITWNNAPRNDTSSPFGFEQSPGVQLLIPAYDLDIGGDGIVDPDGTKYALDITGYVNDRRMNDADQLISILIVADNPTRANEDGSEFESRNVPDEQECDRPFLYVE
jgi:hypothetical protein